MEEEIAQLKKRLQDTIQLRDTLESDIKEKENELILLNEQKNESIRKINNNNTLSSSSSSSATTTTTVQELNQQIKKLETQRETNSMPLAQEREILHRIYKLNKLKDQIEEKEKYENQIKQTREAITSNKNTLRDIVRPDIFKIRNNIETNKTALLLGCNVSELVGTKVECPNDKIGRIIGKQGSNVKALETKNNVDIDIITNNNSNKNKNNNNDDQEKNKNKNKNEADIHLIGTVDSLQAAITNIDKVMSKTEINIPVSETFISYLTSKNIHALNHIRAKYIDSETYCTLLSSTTSSSSTPKKEQQDTKEPTSTTLSSQIMIRGIPESIELMKNEFLQLQETIQMKTRTLSSNQCKMIVGKQGSTIEKLVLEHQVAISINRQQKQEHSNKNNNNDTSMISSSSTEDENDNNNNCTVTLIGEDSSIEKLQDVIQQIIYANADGMNIVPIHPTAKSSLLIKNGTGIQALHKKINELINNKTNDCNTNSKDDEQQQQLPNTNNTNNYFVSVMCGDAGGGLVVKGKNKILASATDLVQKEIKALESTIVYMHIDPFAFPVLIGKNAETVKHLRDGAESVAFDLHRTDGKITICGLIPEEVNKVVDNVQQIITNNQVQRIKINSENFEVQYRDLIRSKGNELRSLGIFFVGEHESNQVVLRGTDEQLKEATTIINTFLENNYTEELTVTDEDMNALLNGGKQSKIVEFSTTTKCKISSDRDRSGIVLMKGLKDNVQTANKLIRAFLYGGEGNVASKITLDEEFMGVVIGKGGKTKKELQEKYPTVSIVVQRKETSIMLRGPEVDVESCRSEIMKMIASVRVTRTYTITDQQANQLNKIRFKHTLLQEVPGVQITLSGTNVTIRGNADDVQVAMSLLKEKCEGIYESRIAPGSSVMYQKLKSSCRDPSYFAKIKRETSSQIALDDKKEEVVISGKKRSDVKAAKVQLLQYFNFLFGGNFLSVPLSTSALRSVVKLSSMTSEVSILSGGARVFLDRDLSSVLIFCPDPVKVTKASEVFKSKLEQVVTVNGNDNDLIFVIQFDKPEDDWLISALIGKQGSHIKKVRQELGDCKIDVDSSNRKVLVTAKEEENLSKAKQYLDEYFKSLRISNVFVTIPRKDMPAFVGKAGSHITELSKQYVGVDLQIVNKTDKSSSSSVRISGTNPATVAAARAGIEEWIASRNVRKRQHKNSESDTTIVDEETMKLEHHQIPAIIGKKGVVAHELEQEYGCVISINRSESSITAKGGSPEQRKNLFNRIKHLLHDGEEATTTIIFGEEKASTHEEVEASNDEIDAFFMAQMIGESTKRIEVEEEIKKESPKVITPLLLKEDNFPSLGPSESRSTNTSGPSDDDSRKSTNLLGGLSWASVVHTQYRVDESNKNEIPHDNINQDNDQVKSDNQHFASYIGDIRDFSEQSEH